MRSGKSKPSDPLADDGLKRRPACLDVFPDAERHETAILGEPFQQARGICDIDSRCRGGLHLCAHVEDELDAIPGTKVDSSKEVRRAKARRVPFDLFADPGIDIEDNLPNSLYIPLQRMIQLAHEFAYLNRFPCA